MLVDSHVNLHGEPYKDDLDDVLVRAKEAGVGAMLTISDRLSSLPAIVAISETRANIWHTVGVHPGYRFSGPRRPRWSSSCGRDR